MKRTTVFLDESLLRCLKQRARAEGKSFAQCVREAVGAYVARPLQGKRPLPSITAMFESGHADTSERVDDIITDIMRRKGPHS